MLLFWLHAGIIAESELVNQHARRVAELAGHASGDELTDSDRPEAGATPPPAGQHADCGRPVEAEGCRPTGRPVVVRRVDESGRQPVGRRRIALARSPATLAAGFSTPRGGVRVESIPALRVAPECQRPTSRGFEDAARLALAKGMRGLCASPAYTQPEHNRSPGVRRANPGARFGRHISGKRPLGLRSRPARRRRAPRATPPDLDGGDHAVWADIALQA